MVAGDAREAFGDALADAAREHQPDVAEDTLDRIRAKAFLAPALIAVAARITRRQGAGVGAGRLGLVRRVRHHAGRPPARPRGDLEEQPVPRRRRAAGRARPRRAADRFLGWVNVGHTDPDRQVALRPASDLDVIARRLDVDGAPKPYDPR